MTFVPKHRAVRAACISLATLLCGCPLTAPAAPDGMVHIATDAPPFKGGFWIDRYEYPDQVGVRPFVYTDLATAKKSCAAAGKRVCTAAEWRRACLGPDGTDTYGYGRTFQSRRCHTEDTLASGHTSMMDATALVSTGGGYPGCATPEGVYDLVGNAEEWVLDDWGGNAGSLEGGAWYTWTGYATCDGNYSREPDYRIDPTQPVFSAGFRCCWSEDAPDDEHVSREQLEADATARLASARSQNPTIPYDPTAEVQTGPGTWMDVYEYPNVPGQYPTVGVTWADAGAMCAAAGKRLCTSDEWDEACGSSMGRRFPYGDEYVPGACPVAEAARSVSGSHFACLSVGGERDLTGGVWEWTSSAFETTGAIAGVSRTRREVRGGSSWSDPSKAVCIPSEGYPETPEDQALPDLGFRCCRGEYAPKPVVAHPGRRKCPEGMISMATGGRDICIDTFEFPNKAAERPTGGLTYGDAVAACAGAGKRICTEEEWLSVCTGQGDRRWPYPGTYVPGRCTDRAGHGSARISGASPECQTPEGVLDLSGGLWEWSSNGPDAGVLHGGGWDFSAGLGQCRSTAHASVDHREPDFGVRCCIGP